MTEATALLALQDLDLRLLKLASQLSSMPQQEMLRKIDQLSKRVSSEITRIMGQRKDAQMEIEAHYREKTAEVQAEADSGAHTHREVIDLERQLTSLAKHIEKSEFRLGPAREQLRRLEYAEHNAKRTLAETENRRVLVQNSLEKESKGIRSDIVRLSREREAAAAALAPERLAAYESARKRFKGLAVERLVGNVPSVCRVKLQPSQFHDLAHGDEITECPYCHRMLITSEEGQE